MTKVADEIWEFALENPDYWSMLKSEDDPPELAEMPQERLEGFHAARREVQRRYVEQLRACWKELQKRAAGGPLEDAFAKNPIERSYRKAEVSTYLPNKKGNFYLSIEPNATEPGADGRVSLFASVEPARKRLSQLWTFLPDGRDGGSWVSFEQPLDPTQASPEFARLLADRFWEGLVNYVNAPDDAGEEGE